MPLATPYTKPIRATQSLISKRMEFRAENSMGTVFSILSCGTLTEDLFLFASVRALYVSAWRPRSDLRLS